MIRTELTLRLQNSPGALARVCDLLAAEAINVSALMLDPSGAMRLIVDNPTHATGVLRERHYEVVERPVLFVQLGNRAGAFASVARMLAASGINLDYVYATVPDNQPNAAIVVGVPDAMRAASGAGL
jgi:hypothetical protein